MVSVLILTHGALAREMLSSARVIAGELENFQALPLDWHDSVEEARQKVHAELELLDRGGGVLILTDIYGGTPSNVAMSFREPGRVEVVSGVNLPMVVRLGCLTSGGMPLSELASWIRDKGKRSILCSCEAPEPEAPEPAAPARRVEPAELVDCEKAER